MPVPFPFQRRQDDPVDPNDDPSQGAYPTNIVANGDPVPETPAPVAYRDAQADEPPAIDPAVMEGMRAPVASVAEPAPSALTPELQNIKTAHDAQLAAKGISPSTELRANVATDNSTPTIVQDKERRPESVYGPNARANTRALATAVSDYEPQKAKGWWNRYAKPAIMGWAAGQSRSTNPGAGLGGALGGILGTAINPTAQDERWKAGKQAELQGQMDQQSENEKTALAAEKTRAEIAKLNAPSAPRAPHFDTDGQGYLRVMGPDGVAHYVRDEKTGQPVKGKSTAHYGTEFDDATGKTYVTEDGKRTSRLATAPAIKVPGTGWVGPGTKFSSDAVAGRQSEADTERIRIENEKARQENARIQTNITQMQQAWESVKHSLLVGGPDNGPIPKMIDVPITDSAGHATGYRKVENPDYREKLNRAQKMEDDIRELRLKIKSEVSAPARQTQPAPAGGYTEQQVRDRWKATPANRRAHKTADEAVAAAKAGGLIPK